MSVVEFLTQIKNEPGQVFDTFVGESTVQRSIVAMELRIGFLE